MLKVEILQHVPIYVHLGAQQLPVVIEHAFRYMAENVQLGVPFDYKLEMFFRIGPNHILQETVNIQNADDYRQFFVEHCRFAKNVTSFYWHQYSHMHLTFHHSN